MGVLEQNADRDFSAIEALLREVKIGMGNREELVERAGVLMEAFGDSVRQIAEARAEWDVLLMEVLAARLKGAKGVEVGETGNAGAGSGVEVDGMKVAETKGVHMRSLRKQRLRRS